MATKEEILESIESMTVLEFKELIDEFKEKFDVTAAAPVMICLLYTSPSPRDGLLSRMPSSA